jgi:hypothetical protein
MPKRPGLNIDKSEVNATALFSIDSDLESVIYPNFCTFHSLAKGSISQTPDLTVLPADSPFGQDVIDVSNFIQTTQDMT